MVDNEFLLYEKDEITFFKKYMIMSHILVSNQGNSKIEALAFLTCYYFQIISGYFSPQLGILDKSNPIDKFLSNLEKGLRLKNLFTNDLKSYKMACYFLITFILVCGIYFYIVVFFCHKTIFL